MEIPICIISGDLACLWNNNKFEELFSSQFSSDFTITDAVPEITEKNMPTVENPVGHVHFSSNDFSYHAIIKYLELDKDDESKKFNKKNKNAIIPKKLENNIFIIYMYDETDFIRVQKENFEQRLDVGLLYIDNYEESIENADDVRKAMLVAMIDSNITKYLLEYDAIIRKLEKDKYIFMIQHKYLSMMQADKFSILEDIKAINAANADETNVTISIGIGSQTETYRKRQDYARSAIDLALGRGGDQVVIKTKDNTLYYGGKSVEQEKNTRVKARVKAHALRDSIELSDRVIIMGHHMPDVDVLGSALGIYRIAADLGKNARIVVGSVSTALAPLIDLFKNNSEYPSDLFLSQGQAEEYVGNGAGVLLVIVDVNRPSRTDAPELIERASTVVVIDHHRQTDEVVKNATLSYVEPFASSACEMVAEIVQYSGEEVRLRTLEADALYSGIMVDTNNFMNKPGVRTFEAVAFLRRCGAEIMRIRKMFRTDIREYKIQAEAVRNMHLFMDSYAIAPCHIEGFPDPTIIGSKIANTFLDIQGVKASFVLTPYDKKIYISARSIDELNVQLVMERLGGGGHINMAGAQLSDCTLEEGAQMIKDVLLEMKKDGEID
ncbi:MAG: DHH family phosphoesterase [Eubacterium sp.]|nr:DHH family phosphoesterase [Eubacterium sp.]